VQRIGTDDPAKVSAALEGMTSSDMFARNAVWRKKDHMVLHDFYVGQGKQPNEIASDSDYFKIVDTISGEIALGPESQSTCKHDW
jgi:branched-chain amino acid transport system substrate-binding protein